MAHLKLGHTCDIAVSSWHCKREGFNNEAEGLNALAFLKAMSLEHILNLVIKRFFGLSHQGGSLVE